MSPPQLDMTEAEKLLERAAHEFDRLAADAYASFVRRFLAAGYTQEEAFAALAANETNMEAARATMLAEADAMLAEHFPDLQDFRRPDPKEGG